GIRDGHVTGVQTCALPIYVHVYLARHDPLAPRVSLRKVGSEGGCAPLPTVVARFAARSSLPPPFDRIAAAEPPLERASDCAGKARARSGGINRHSRRRAGGLARSLSRRSLSVHRCSLRDAH